MKVKQLIKRLNQLPPDMVIAISEFKDPDYKEHFWVTDLNYIIVEGEKAVLLHGGLANKGLKDVKVK